ncbi:hypothetical protein DB35_23070 [Streptomyces abyssalis]|uniref:Uncharacterized protein n=1 Tax=Streptomyces abyssalis TaxID=933944 RepID=A0A1E7JP48_9ACTN|nr:hypothetical protein [Streptomyces abyssalis]OEU86590.1 hypothetical protein DB35_23070 [Streptomyces abyssalis]OEU90023.1 hypothetical protein AN215_10450 [Streptomyces abyssalis]OEV27748.1 hypothetical protein AN219_22130 [Streptomyces nanshensis]
MQTPEQIRESVRECADELRAVLADHGIKLPSLGVDLTTYASEAPYPLVSLGNCRLDTARRLVAVLQEARRTGPTDDRH